LKASPGYTKTKNYPGIDSSLLFPPFEKSQYKGIILVRLNVGPPSKLYIGYNFAIS